DREVSNQTPVLTRERVAPKPLPMGLRWPDPDPQLMKALFPDPPKPVWAVRFVPVPGGASGVSVLVNGDFWNPSGAADAKATWLRTDGEKTFPLPDAHQGAAELRVVAVSRDWGKDFKLEILKDGRVVETIKDSKTGDRLLKP
ncbi:MAG: hypothetical protein K2V38_19150, partial [Gemmataceae bacterium]|nr:hypothetical protein [Gemmataceae bacterium]